MLHSINYVTFLVFILKNSFGWGYSLKNIGNWKEQVNLSDTNQVQFIVQKNISLLSTYLLAHRHREIINEMESANKIIRKFNECFIK